MTVHTKRFQIEERRRQVANLVAEALTEHEIADKLGVDRTTISKDIKALKLISQQFVYDITKSDFTYYYKQCLDATRLIMKKQWEIANKKNNEHLTKEDLIRLKALSDIRETVSTLSNYYGAALSMHKTPMQIACAASDLGIRPGTKVRKMTPEAEAEEIKALEEDDDDKVESFYLKT
jgi:IS30 family transposase